MRCRTIVLACAITLALPGTSPAATVTFSWGDIPQQSLRFLAAPGERNALVVSAVAPVNEGGPPRIRLSDAGAPVTSPSPGCPSEDAHTVVCDIAIAFSADLGDGDDTYTSTAGQPADISGGPGNDVLTGDLAPGTAAFAAQTGNELSSASESSMLDGGPGDDVLSGGADSDMLWGGPGNDRLAGNASFDALCGGMRQGTYECSPAPGSGNDVLDGGGYQDYLVAGDGNDWLIGGDGADSFSAGPGDDLIDATADRTPDTRGLKENISAGPGNDRILAADGMPDDIYCNEGHDIVERDAIDFADLGCTAPDGPPATSIIAPATVKLDHARRVLSVRVTCPPNVLSGCAGSVKVTTVRGNSRVRLAAGRYTPLAPATARSVRLRVGPSIRRRFHKRKPTKVTVQITNSRASRGFAVRVERVAKVR